MSGAIPSKEDIVGAIKEILRDKDMQDRIVAFKNPTKPRSWNKKTNAPYYREKYGLELKAMLDKMMIDGQHRIFRFDEFPELSKNSLYLKVNQSKLYLLENLDPDGRYAHYLNHVRIRRTRVGVRLSSDTENDGSFMPSTVITINAQDSLREKIDKFLEESQPGQELLINKLVLEEGDVEALQASLMPLENFAANITHTSVKIVRLS